MLTTMNGNGASRLRHSAILAACRNAVVWTVAVAVALFEVFRSAFISDDDVRDDGRQIHDCDFSGEMNYRTGRLDSGTDPHGWYDRD